MIYRWLNQEAQQFLDNGYLINGQTVDQRVTDICYHAERLLNKPGFAEKFKEYIQKGYYSLSTPVWANFGLRRGLPISCFGSYMDDTMESIVRTYAEVSMMTKYGGGTSAYFGKLRPRGSLIQDNGESGGPVSFMLPYETLIKVISQGSTRRGSFAAYLDIESPDIMEFLKLHSDGNPIQQMSFGVCVTDDFMQRMIDGDKTARKVWARVLEVRANTGFPYIIFIDNANKNAPPEYRGKITHSNLCTEIFLPDNSDESFVCDLGSMNILYYDEWKHTDAVEMMIYFLDAVMTEFIEKARGIYGLDRAVRFAERHRAVGLGWLGWHSYLQSHMIPFDSMEAKFKNVEIAKFIERKANEATIRLGSEYGVPEALSNAHTINSNTGRRNGTVSAIAPTTSSAFIIGQVSQSIEPFTSNYYIKDLAKGKFSIRNRQLEQLLEEKGKNTKTTWKSILSNGGSVQHLEFLDDHEKSVFKTFEQISPREIIIQAAQRQKYIDQGQSLNLWIHPKMPIKDLNALLIEAWQLGVKSLYYQHSMNAAQEFSRKLLNCSSCEA